MLLEGCCWGVDELVGIDNMLCASSTSIFLLPAITRVILVGFPPEPPERMWTGSVAAEEEKDS